MKSESYAPYVVIICCTIFCAIACTDNKKGVQKQKIVETEQLQTFPEFPIELGKVKPGTENTDTPIRNEWKTQGEWANIYGKDNCYLYVHYNKESDTFELMAYRLENQGPIPTIQLSGASNQLSIKFIEDK